MGCGTRYTNSMIRSIKKTFLENACQNCGIGKSGPKHALWQALTTTEAASLNGKSVLSVDLGLKNIAICKFAVSDATLPRITNWHLTSLQGADQKNAFIQPIFSQLAHEFANIELLAQNPDVILLEQQRLRSNGGKSVPEIIARLNALEAMLHAIIQTKTQSMSFSVNPARVMAYWVRNNSRGLLKGSGRYKLTKETKTSLVQKWIEIPESAPFTIDADLANAALSSTRKYDDLCDSLLQGVTFIKWQSNLKLLQKALHQAIESDSGSPLIAAVDEMDQWFQTFLYHPEVSK